MDNPERQLTYCSSNVGESMTDEQALTELFERKRRVNYHYGLFECDLPEKQHPSDSRSIITRIIQTDVVLEHAFRTTFTIYLHSLRGILQLMHEPLSNY